MELIAQGPETVTMSVLLDAIQKQAAKSDQSGMIYLFVLIVCLLGVGGFFVLRYMLGHARDIHTEANRTLLEISSKYDARFASLTETFSKECNALRSVILRTISDSRDMVHAMRDIGSTAVSAREYQDRITKAEEDLKLKRDRDQAAQH